MKYLITLHPTVKKEICLCSYWIYKFPFTFKLYKGNLTKTELLSFEKKTKLLLTSNKFWLCFFIRISKKTGLVLDLTKDIDLFKYHFLLHHKNQTHYSFTQLKSNETRSN